MGRFLDLLGDERVYPITDRPLSGRSHADQVRYLADAGYSLAQLREKELSPGDFYREAEEALCVARRHGMRLIINDRVDLAIALKADGVHLGQDDLHVEKARQLLGENAIIGFSTHNLAQAQRAAQMPIDYLAFGPIFPTRSKQNSEPVVGVSALTSIRQEVPGLPLVAIGGINAANRDSVLAAGADAVALISEIWKNCPEFPEKLQK